VARSRGPWRRRCLRGTHRPCARTPHAARASEHSPAATQHPAAPGHPLPASPCEARAALASRSPATADCQRRNGHAPVPAAMSRLRPGLEVSSAADFSRQLCSLTSWLALTRRLHPHQNANTCHNTSCRHRQRTSPCPNAHPTCCGAGARSSTAWQHHPPKPNLERNSYIPQPLFYPCYLILGMFQKLYHYLLSLPFRIFCEKHSLELHLPWLCSLGPVLSPAKLLPFGRLLLLLPPHQVPASGCSPVLPPRRAPASHHQRSTCSTSQANATRDGGTEEPPPWLRQGWMWD